MRVSVGVMQGRLLPPFEGRFQAFPAGRWEEEFPLASAAGLSCIEWIFEEPHESDNPLGSEAGIDEIQRISQEHGMSVRSVCADYYMSRRLVEEDGSVADSMVEHLEWLIGQASALGVAYMVLPFVDASSLRNELQIRGAESALKRVLPSAERLGVELHLECDLPPRRFAGLLSALGHSNLKANYDIGNSASLGYDPVEELSAIGRFLGSVHVKDRVLHGSTVPLGTGDADFIAAFGQISLAGFERWFILQAARGADGEEVELAERNRMFVQKHFWDRNEI